MRLNKESVQPERRCWLVLSMHGLLLLMFAVGCTSAEKEEVISCEKTISLGQGEALIDNQEWTTETVVWSESATGIQIILPPNDGYNITLVAQQNTEGTSIAEADFPLQVGLDAQQGGWGILYEDSDSHSTQDGGTGSLILETQDGDDLHGCFSFQIDDISIEEGFFSAQRL